MILRLVFLNLKDDTIKGYQFFFDKIGNQKTGARTFIIIEIDFFQDNSTKRIDANILIANYNESFIIDKNIHAIRNIERLNKINCHIAASGVIVVVGIAIILLALKFISSWNFVNGHRFLIGNRQISFI